MTIRRRQTASTLGAEDLLFQLKFRESEAQHADRTLINCLNLVYEATYDLIKKLQARYDRSRDRYIFLAIMSKSLTSPIYLGLQNLHDPHAQIANRVRPHRAARPNGILISFCFSS